MAVWGLETMGDVDFAALFDEDMLGDDLESWLGESTLMKSIFVKMRRHRRHDPAQRPRRRAQDRPPSHVHHPISSTTCSNNTSLTTSSCKPRSPTQARAISTSNASAHCSGASKAASSTATCPTFHPSQPPVMLEMGKVGVAAARRGGSRRCRLPNRRSDELAPKLRFLDAAPRALSGVRAGTRGHIRAPSLLDSGSPLRCGREA